MAVKFGCPQCGAGITVHFARAGDLVFCRSCGARVPVPEPGQELPITGPSLPAGVDRPPAPAATSTPPPTGAMPTVGLVLRETFRIFTSHFGGILALTAVALGPLIVAVAVFFIAVYSIGAANPGTALPPAALAGLVGWGLLAVAMLMVLLQVSTASITLGVFQVARGRPMLIAECLRAGFRRLPSVLLVSLVVGLLTMIGYVACIVPGILVSLALPLSIPATVVEGLSTGDAMTRSRNLTRGARGMVFGVFAVLWAAQFAANLVFGLVPDPASTILSLLLYPVALALYPTAFAVMYFELRCARESIRVDDIVAVFE